jgi:hypothetical protein
LQALSTEGALTANGTNVGCAASTFVTGASDFGGSWCSASITHLRSMLAFSP